MKLKEGMKMMGVSDTAIWMSWIFTYMIIFAIADLATVILLKINIVRFTSVGYLFLFFYAFSLACICLACLFTVLFKSPKAAVNISVSLVMY
jgi:hypothetical protein